MASAKESEKSKTLSFWVDQIDSYEKKFKDWEKRGEKIVDRYMDKRNDNASAGARFNILWSNVQTLQPALYASPPKPNVDRRWQEDDDLGRYAAMALERSASYFINDQFDAVVKNVVLDRLLPGRGVAWVRYEPTFEQTEQVTEGEEPEEDFVSEKICTDYVYWSDFGHTWARVWEEVRAVWRVVYMDRSELKKRFPDKYSKIPLDAKEIGASEDDKATRSKIYEIWDSRNRKAIWINKSMSDILDELDDPLKLQNFFPCPKPLYATLSTKSLQPVADYVQYQDQADELDNLTGRIALIQDSVKVAGVYDASAEGLDRLLLEGAENKLIPVSQWAVFGEKGLENAISFLPLDMIITALTALYEAREKAKQDLYEITGISDIIRGASDPNETLGAQELKGKYAGLRLDDKQKEVATFCRSMVRIIAEIIAEHFSIDTIKQISGLKLFTQVEKQQMQQVMQLQQQYQKTAEQAKQSGQQPPPPPQLPEITDEMQEMLELPTWEEIEQLIKNDTARSFRIDIETDSTIKTDQENDKKERMEYITAIGGFINQSVQLPPELAGLAMQMIQFASNGFKIGREFETELDSTINKMKKQAAEPKPPQPDPDIEKAKMEAQTKQAQMQQDGQIKQAELQQQGQIEQMKLQSSQTIEQQKLQSSMEIENAKAQSSIQIETNKEQIRQQAETERFAMEIQKELKLEEIRQGFENQRHAVTLDNQKQIADSQPEPTEA